MAIRASVRKKIAATAFGIVTAVGGFALGQAQTTTTALKVAPVSSFPSPTTTGVTSGTVLTSYTGPTTITSCGTVIQNKTITGGLDVRATNGKTQNWNDPVTARANACVIIENSVFKVAGGTDNAINSHYTGGPYCGTGSCGQIFLNHDEINETGTPTGIINLLVETGFHGWNLYVHGGDQGINCDSNCEIHDSYLEASKIDTTGNAHMDAFSDNGGHNIVLDHNTLTCHVTNGPTVSGGCSGDLGFFGDFNQIDSITVNNNYFVASGDPAYCVYTGAFQSGKKFTTATNLTYTNNVWGKGANGKCATYGPVADWATGNGNVSCNNLWEDGTKLGAMADTASCPSVPPVTTTTVASPTTVVPTTLPPPPPTTVAPTTTTTVAPTTTTTKPVVTTTTTVPVTPTTECLTSTTPKVCTVLP